MAVATIANTIIDRVPMSGGLTMVIGQSVVTAGDEAATNTDLTIATGLSNVRAFAPTIVLGGTLPALKSDTSFPKAGGSVLITVDDDTSTPPKFSWIAMGQGGL